MTEKLAYTPKEAAALLGIGHNAIYELCHQKDFPCIRVGARLVIPADALRRWLDVQAAGSGGAT